LKLTSDSLATQLGERLLPAYLISGDEPLLAAEAADAVRACARGAGFTEREVHFIERAADWDEVRAAAANLSLFAARRVVEIRLASARPGTAGNAALIALLEARDEMRRRVDVGVEAHDHVGLRRGDALLHMPWDKFATAGSRAMRSRPGTEPGM